MRTLSVMIVGATIVCAATLPARAQFRPPRPCATNFCLLKQIDALRTAVADLTNQVDSATAQLHDTTKQIETVTRQLDTVNKQLESLSSDTLKSGQTITLNSPSGCLSYSTPVDLKTGPVWWSHPCKNGDWVIQSRMN
jgi:hypothetical protein